MRFARGLALLETTIILFVSTLMLLGSLCLWHGLSDASYARHALETALHKGTPKAYKLTTVAGAPALTLNRQALEDFTGVVAESVSAAMERRGLAFWSEVLATEVTIDPKTGVVTNINEITSARRAGGDLSPSADSLKSTDLIAAVRTWSNVTGPGEAALLAIPAAVQDPSSSLRYLDRVIAVAARVIAAPDRELLTRQWGILSGNREIKASNMVLLRGDIE